MGRQPASTCSPLGQRVVNEHDGACSHCQEPLRIGTRISAEIDGRTQHYCCTGCAAVAGWLHEGGLGDFYRLRTVASARAVDVDQYASWDSAAFAQLYVRRDVSAASADGEYCEMDVTLDGLRCAACAWLIPRLGQTIAGLQAIDLNAATGRAHLVWDPAKVALSQIVGRLAQLGYEARVTEQGADLQRRARRTLLKRIALAGIAAMQAMMMSEALYFGGQDLDVGTRDFLRWITLILATPVVLWSAAPFFRGAWVEFRLRRWGMDTLVALSVGLAYSVSVIETLRGGPEVYFDAAVMFVFFLLVARYIEAATRDQARAAVSRTQFLPAVVNKWTEAGWLEVALTDVLIGDVLQVAAGQNVPADGALVSARAEFDESLLTGEPQAQARRAGDAVLAGSIPLTAPIQLRVSALGAATWLAQLGAMMDRAQQQKPVAQRRNDDWARVFVVAMIGLALLAALVWSFIDISRALPVALAVLAAACPCAFALAQPAAQAAAQASLARRGVLVAQPDALIRAAGINTLAFDKTGTLTHGKPALVAVTRFDETDSEEKLLALAAALERAHKHPLAYAFRSYDHGQPLDSARVHVGDGVSGLIDGASWRLGRRGFVDASADSDDGRIWLARESKLLAAFQLRDSVRVDADAAMAQLRVQGVDTLILSGDAEPAVRELADAIKVNRAFGGLRPEDKLQRLQALQQQGFHVAMIGDGINDAPVLAAAELSIVMGEGAALAQRNADVLLMRPQLQLLPFTFNVARRMRRIVAQNMAWSVAYHALMLPAALLGVMPPWFAALGMSLSSLAVTLNASRLLRVQPPVESQPPPNALWAETSR